LLNEKSVWTVHCYASGDPSDGSKVCIPTLKAAQTMPGSALSQLAESNQEKSHLLQTTFLPKLTHSELNSLLMDYPRPRFDFNPVTNDQIHQAISKLGPHKAPGQDSIPNAMLVQCTDLLVPHLGPIYHATFKLGVYPDCWKDSVMIVLINPAKLDHMAPNTYQPIALLNTMAKVLSTCIAEDLVHVAKIQNLLPSNHFSCCPGRTTSDSLHYVTMFIKNAWRKKEVISALFLDIKGAFPNVVLNQPIHTMRMWGVPSQYTDWIACKVSGRWMTLKFNSYESEPLSMTKGIDQGCPLSGIAYQF